ncbi:MAG: J domain-containing protein, partial [Chloroflexota bacterium]
MPAKQAPIVDPYATLGLEPGATAAEVKRAYRRLAKAFHPDSAGEPAIPRFLAIQAAYEQIRTGRATLGGTRAGRAAGASAAPAAEPWRADPDRTRAARERARRGNAGTGTGSRTGAAASGASTGAGATGGPAAGGR